MNLMTRSYGIVLAASLAVAWPAQDAAAFPDDGVDLIVAYGAGGGTDVTARQLANDLSATLGQTVTVQNVTGGGGWNGWGTIAQADPTGYTIGYINVPNLYAGMLNPETPREETLASYTPLMNHVTDYCVWAVRADSPYMTVADVIEAAKTEPLSLAAHGFGGDDHLAMIRMERATDASFNVIHNNSTAISLTQVLGGHVDVLGANVSEVIAQAEEGELRILGVMSNERSEFLPDIPTFREQGFDHVWSVSRGIAGPSGLPDDIRQALIDALTETLNSDVHKAAARQLGLAIEVIDGEDYTDFLAETRDEVKALMDW